jgi:hypothetical protein
MSYAMNQMVHNTNVGDGAFPCITGRPLCSKELARWQLWLWFAGMLIDRDHPLAHHRTNGNAAARRRLRLQ